LVCATPIAALPPKGANYVLDVEIYNAIRAEIASYHVLMHWISLVVILALLAGTWVVEKSRPTILNIFLPLLSLAGAAAMVRFDLFIHRQAAYLRALEAQMQTGRDAFPMWEQWKNSLRATAFVVPVADAIACAVVVIPTIYLVFGPARQYFQFRQWRGEKVFAWGVSLLLPLLLCALAIVPQIAGWRAEP
jgi:hypothetical protein